MSRTRKVRHAFAGSSRMLRLRLDEGLTPQPDERRLRERDRSGQKLRDVINPKTGFCVGVTGPMESDGHTVRAAKPTSGAGPALPEYDAATGRWFVGEDRLVIRTTDTPEGPMSRTRIIKRDDEAYDSAPTHEKIKKSPKIRSNQAVRPAGDDKRRTRGPRYTDAQIKDFLREYLGWTGPLTREIRTAAIATMIKHSTVAQYSQDLRHAPKTGVAKRNRV